MAKKKSAFFVNKNSSLTNGIAFVAVQNAKSNIIIKKICLIRENTEGKKEIANKIDEIYTPLLNFKIS